jgi:AraC-like DNA-binding protein
MSDLDYLCRLAERHATQSSETAIPGFRIGRLSATARPIPMLYEPMVCLVLSGAKRLYAGNEVIDYGEGQLLISAVDMPVTARVLIDERRGHYLSLVLRFDPITVASLAAEIDVPRARLTRANFGIARSDGLLLDAWRRMCELLERPDEIPFLAPLIEREILFRLLRGPQADLLAQVATADLRVRQIRATAAWLRANCKESVSVEHLATMAGMSVTAFHRHFKQAMSMSPLQYQKTVRLYEARERLVAGPRDAASVAYAVGYESASQFSREYKRLFGATPTEDIRRMRSSGKAGPDASL